MEKDACILVVGHDDIIERSLTRHFKEEGFSHFYASTEIGLNTTVQPAVYEFFQEKRPEYIFLGSVRSGGIEANQKFCGDFFYQNAESQNNVVYAAHKFGVRKLVYFASSCVYPKEAAQPMREDMLLTGPLEPTSESYALAKIAGIKLIEAYRKQYGLNAVCMIPATVYGPEADTDIEHAHVLGALVTRFSRAKKEQAPKVVLWGTGQPRREFIYSTDFVAASLHVMERDVEAAVVHAGSGEDIPIQVLAEKIAAAVGYEGAIEFDANKPDGARQKLLDSSRLRGSGWRPAVGLEEGLRKTVQWYNEQEG